MKRKQPRRACPFRLILTQGGGAQLFDLEAQELVWTSTDDPDFMEEFPDFLTVGDVADVLDYLEEVGELSTLEADQCDIREEFMDAAAAAGLAR